ncbi:hypothetical protein [Ornithobacterium rhinotracheale]|uniref:hypothetical protein n=1 Tax=Ornithobacterium rhinotracheale TaxID=28251 RepID=UPI001FF65A50|nr:hypothetical protein [Ornithobacterium rhinotracheale]MCK0204390.1 hypothetical protein [Ornithobacterium rhinotracheale]
MSEVYLDDFTDEKGNVIIGVSPRGSVINEKNEERARNTYQFNINPQNFKDINYSIKLPIYNLTKNRKKGEKVGEIIIKGDNTPALLITSTNPWSNNGFRTDYNKIKYDNYDQLDVIEGIQFYSQGDAVPVIFENINKEYIEKIDKYKLTDSKGIEGWAYKIKIKEEKKGLEDGTEVKAFDIYYGIEKEDGSIVKAEGVDKREIKLYYSIY